VAIAGGGLVGLSLAYELASRGATVTLIDAGYPGRATDAGAGILAPDTHPTTEHFWWALTHGAGDHYPLLLDRLRHDGADTDPSGYATCGLLSVGLRESEESWFGPFAQRVIGRADGRVREITPEDAVVLFPPLGPVHRALHYPGAARIDGRGMADALRQAASTRGVRMVTGTVSGVRAAAHAPSTARAVHGVLVGGADEVRCGALVVAGGAWSEPMGEWLRCALPITPTKGQIVHLATQEESGDWPIVQPLLSHYLVPWPGGRVACGGTFEPGAGFSVTVTAAGLHELLRECLVVAPGLADASYIQTRVGLRPTSPDDRPVLGVVPGWENAWVATGHGANGLLLGPYSAKLLAEHILEEPGRTVIPEELDPARFA
jgi:D-amino-acid dehydrogenase